MSDKRKYVLIALGVMAIVFLLIMIAALMFAVELPNQA